MNNTHYFVQVDKLSSSLTALKMNEWIKRKKKEKKKKLFKNTNCTWSTPNMDQESYLRKYIYVAKDLIGDIEQRFSTKTPSFCWMH